MTNFAVDGVSSATPLAMIKKGESVNLLNMFVGNIAGSIGETSVIALLAGGIYLLVKKVITWRIPFIYIITLAVFVLIFGGYGMDLHYVAVEVCGGGLMLGAFFMATDYVTSPITAKGQIIFALLLGILTGILNIFSFCRRGFLYTAIIFCNMLVPLIEKISIPVAFGKEGLKNGK